jgi:hypothetical protein
MESAREINKKLDEIIEVNRQLRELENDLPDSATLKDIETGEPVAKDFVLNKGQEQLAQIKEELNKLTNNGQNCRDMFTNNYYVNDMSQDKLIAKEIKANKLKKELENQKSENN